MKQGAEPLGGERGDQETSREAKAASGGRTRAVGPRGVAVNSVGAPIADLLVPIDAVRILRRLTREVKRPSEVGARDGCCRVRVVGPTSRRRQLRQHCVEGLVAVVAVLHPVRESFGHVGVPGRCGREEDPGTPLRGIGSHGTQGVAVAGHDVRQCVGRGGFASQALADSPGLPVKASTTVLGRSESTDALKDRRLGAGGRRRAVPRPQVAGAGSHSGEHDRPGIRWRVSPQVGGRRRHQRVADHEDRCRPFGVSCARAAGGGGDGDQGKRERHESATLPRTLARASADHRSSGPECPVVDFWLTASLVYTPEDPWMTWWARIHEAA